MDWKGLLDTWFLCAKWIFVYMSILSLFAIFLRRNDIADIGWGMGFILVSALSLLGNEHPTLRGYIVSIMVFVWGGRLSLHIYLRNHSKPEDFRYRQWREEWGVWLIPRTYLQVFLLQGFLLWIIAIPVIAINSASYIKFGILDFIGLFVWMIGFFFESVGDFQLRRFAKDPSNRGRILTTGLWKYTRHPNYFGEVVLWWGMFLMALSTPFGWITVISPLTITVLILKVSGIPMLERKYDGNPEFEYYRKRTSPFFPMRPKEKI